jgi:two-component system sensor histidine kinase and response regulator WspE
MVTEISGRGVGLDVVQSMVKAVGGSVRVATSLGQQTVFTLQLPITMSVIRALLVDIGGEPYAFPLMRIDQILFCRHADIRTVEGRQYFEHDGVFIGLVMAAQILETTALPLGVDPMPVVVISDRGQQFGMIVDSFLGERDLEVRPLDPRLGKVPNINSASLLENGNPVLIVDVEDLVRSIDNVLMGRRLSRVEFERMADQARQRKRILVVDDSITVRELERQLLQSRGFAVDVAVDGMDGWNAVRTTHYDLVVSDVDMPRMDGIELVALIKADPARKDIPVVIVSYKDREEDRLRGLDAGANRYLTKSSFHDETFLRTIVDLIGEPTQ